MAEIDKKLFRDGPYADLFSQGVQVGNTLYLSGQVGTDDSGVAPADILAQMTNAYAHIENVLKQYGATMDNIVDETWFVTDINDCMSKVGELFGARAEIYGKKPEVCQTLIGVDSLVDPSFHIEIKAVAVLA
ncbi:MAG: RidA family protein [Alphaproteobacteria bacterium]|nr:RidA family protein [Alphaproteobacteria bacterium]